MQVVAVIPARYASTRFPGKPLAAATGKPLIQHVYERVRQARSIERCIVATDDERIAAAIRGFGGEVAMTRPEHPSGTDRIAEAVSRLPPNAAATASDADLIVLNVQGDEPEIEPDFLDRLVERIRMGKEPCATLACPFPVDGDPHDPNAVKVVLDANGRALYFSRALVPYPRDASGQPAGSGPWLLHLGVYAYRRKFLLEFASWPPGRLEQIEKLEQLRVLERGFCIGVEVVPRASMGIDTPADYEAFVNRWRAETRGRG